jgi:hypothetical protein
VSTITSANAKLTLTVRSGLGIVVGPFTVQGFASDDAFATEPVERAQALMGVDGKMSAGWVPNMTPQVITLQADSPSVSIFETWDGAQAVLRDVLFADGVLSLPGLGKAYALVKGVLTRITPIPQGKKVLQPVTYEITWETVQAAPVTV